MADPIGGQEVFYFEWNGSSHDMFRGIITNVFGGGLHPNISLRYQDGTQSKQATNVPSIESLVTLTGNDYWEGNRVEQEFIPPKINNVPVRGDIIWVNRWDATAGEHFWRLGYIRSIQGQPVATSRCNTTVWDPGSDDAINVNSVDSWASFATPQDADGEDYWVHRNLGPGDA